MSVVFQQVSVPIVSNDKCKNMFLRAGRHEYIPDIFMCAGFDTGGRDSCQVPTQYFAISEDYILCRFFNVKSSQKKFKNGCLLKEKIRT